MSNKHVDRMLRLKSAVESAELVVVKKRTELDQAVLEAYESGLSKSEIVRVTGLARQTVYDSLRRAGGAD